MSLVESSVPLFSCRVYRARRQHLLLIIGPVCYRAGGTFALYSQLRRQGTRAAREAIEGGGDGSRRDADWRQRLIQGRAMQNVLRVLVVLGVGAIMVSCTPTLCMRALPAFGPIRMCIAMIPLAILRLLSLACLPRHALQLCERLHFLSAEFDYHVDLAPQPAKFADRPLMPNPLGCRAMAFSRRLRHHRCLFCPICLCVVLALCNDL